MGERGTTSHARGKNWDENPCSMLLTGEYDINIDDKYRLSMPAEIRKSINPEKDGEGFFLVPGLNRRPWLYAERYYEKKVEQDQQELLPDEDQLDFDHMNFALTTKLEFDPQGRLAIPAKTFRRMEMSREVTLIGARDHLEIWNRADWERRREELLARSAELFHAKRARRMPGKTGVGQDVPPRSIESN